MSPRQARRFRYRPLLLTLGLLLGVGASGSLGLFPPQAAKAQNGGTITLRADVQEANAATGVITARGNVQVEYPARDIYATSAQAQYFSNERRIVLSGNVVVLQEGNRLRAETVTYLVDEERFVALPQPSEQVETIYILPESEAGPPSTSSAPAPTLVQPAPEPPASLQVSPVGPGADSGSSEPLNPTQSPSRSPGR
ncbi:MAG TPA: LptA/OstA family protein [Trichocoleus sp.]